MADFNGYTYLYVGAIVGILSVWYVYICSSVWTLPIVIVTLYWLLQKLRKLKRIDPRGHGVVITGCDTGFGHDAAIALHACGFTVFAGCLRPDVDGANKLRDERSDRLHAIPLDVTSDESVEGALAYVQAHLPNYGLRGVINNAGIMITGDAEWLTVAIYRKAMEVNFFGATRVTRAFLPLLRRTKGRVLFNSSVRGLFAMPGASAYHATKHAMETYADSLRLEMIKFGVKVTVIRPGKFGAATAIVSPEQVRRLDAEKEEMWSAAKEEVRQTYGKHYIEGPLIPLREGLKDTYTDTSPVTDVMRDALVDDEPATGVVVGGGDALYDSDAMIARLYGALPTWLSMRILTRMTQCHKFPSKDGKTKYF